MVERNRQLVRLTVINFESGRGHKHVDMTPGPEGEWLGVRFPARRSGSQASKRCASIALLSRNFVFIWVGGSDQTFATNVPPGDPLKNEMEPWVDVLHVGWIDHCDRFLSNG